MSLKGQINMAGTNSADMDLDDFTLEAPKKGVGQILPENIDAKLGEKDENGDVHTYSKIEKEVINKLDEQVDKILSELLTAPVNSKELKDITSALNKMGDKEVNQTSNMSSRMLDRPLRSMRSNDFGDGKSIAGQLKTLRSKITELDPSKRDALFSRNKFLGIKLPFGIGNKVDSYFQEYKSSESQLQDIVKALYNGKDELLEDNAEIEVERENMQNMMARLEQYAYIMKKLDKKIEDKLPALEAEDRIKASDIKQEILFPVRQKRMDILQHMAVCMQGYMALGVVKKNNVELMRGVDRATTTTMAALRTAVIVSEALGTQKLVLDQINAVNEVTNRMILANADMLGQQSQVIQKGASEAAINVETLNKAFQQIFKAMDAMDAYREQSLPKMKSTVESLEKTVQNAKGYLQTRERNAVSFTEDLAKETAEDKKVVSIRP